MECLPERLGQDHYEEPVARDAVARALDAQATKAGGGRSNRREPSGRVT